MGAHWPFMMIGGKKNRPLPHGGCAPLHVKRGKKERVKRKKKNTHMRWPRIQSSGNIIFIEREIIHKAAISRQVARRGGEGNSVRVVATTTITSGVAGCGRWGMTEMVFLEKTILAGDCTRWWICWWVGLHPYQGGRSPSCCGGCDPGARRSLACQEAGSRRMARVKRASRAKIT